MIGSVTRRAIAAFHYSRDFKWPDRAAFVIHRAGLQNLLIVRLSTDVCSKLRDENRRLRL